MATGFDAYHKWLGIPPAEQPPNHYRLLGLGLFESDPDVIQAAADRQMAHLKTYRNGPHNELSEELLNQIATAKLCLLKASRKAQYDAELRAKAQPNAVPQSVGAGAAAPLPTPAPTASLPQPSGVNLARPGVAPAPRMSPVPGVAPGFPAATASMTPPPPTIRPMPPPPQTSIDDEEEPAVDRRLAIGLVAGSLVATALVVWLAVRLMTGRPADNTLANSTGNPPVVQPTENQTPATTVFPTNPPATDNNPGTAKPTETGNTPAKVNTSGNSQTGSSTGGDSPKPAIDTNTGNHNASVTPANHSPTDNPATNHGEKPPATTTVGNPPIRPTVPTTDVKPVRPTPARGGKLPPPDAAALADAQKPFAEKTAAATPAALLKLVAQWDDAALVYLALSKALDGAVSEGDVATATSAIDALNERFVVDALALRVKAMTDIRAHITASTGWEALVLTTSNLINEALAAGRRQDAMQLAITQLVAARKTGSPELIRKATLAVVDIQSGATSLKPATPPSDSAAQ